MQHNLNWMRQLATSYVLSGTLNSTQSIHSLLWHWLGNRKYTQAVEITTLAISKGSFSGDMAKRGVTVET